MWTRGKDKTDLAKFAYSLYTDSGIHVETIGGFATHTEAERAAEAAQRGLLRSTVVNLESARSYMDAVDADEMTTDELLAALQS
jgi:hypothetical protein